MCGIVGYTGHRACGDLILESLKRLEYRGYDSAGLAVYNKHSSAVDVHRAVGKLGALAAMQAEKPLIGNLGIGHTRWATHGSPTENNAHPQVADGIVLVHNGIVENHRPLRQALLDQGVRFTSETDTEVIAQTIAQHLKKQSFLEAVRTTVASLQGTFALAILSRNEPETIVIAKQASPLVIGVGESETWCASDASALLPHTQNMVFLEDGEIGVLTPQGFQIQTIEGKTVSRKPITLDWTPAMAEKGGFKHYMLKEIHEQSRAVEDTLRGRVRDECVSLDHELLGIESHEPSRVLLTACGTSFHASLLTRYWVETLAKTATDVELASESRGREPVFETGNWVVGMTQSGETLDTLSAMKRAKERRVRTIAITNVTMSAIAREAAHTLMTHAGPEIGVASTKSFSAQMLVGLMLAMDIGRRKKSLDPKLEASLTSALIKLPSLIAKTIKSVEKATVAIARDMLSATDVLFIGRGLSYPIALEGALKLKEISYIHAEGYAAGELKHGPIALIDEGLPVIAIAPKDEHFERTLSNMQEVRARGAKVIAITDAPAETVRDIAHHTIVIPSVDALLSPFISVIPLQLIAYHVADIKGTDVDQPRNLAKTVTVE